MGAPSLPALQAKFAYTFREFQLLGGPGEVTARKFAAAGRLQLVKHGGRTVILHAEIERYFASLPAFSDETKREVRPPRKRRAV